MATAFHLTLKFSGRRQVALWIVCNKSQQPRKGSEDMNDKIQTTSTTPVGASCELSAELCNDGGMIPPIYGHVEIHAWIEFDGSRLIGMGNKKTYDANGVMIDYSEVPTGVVGIFA